MKFPKSILITSVGSSNGQSVFKIINHRFPDIDLHICDSNNPDRIPLLRGKMSFTKVPLADHDDYKDAIFKICREKEIDIIIPIHDNEVVEISRFANELRSKGTETIISSMECIKIVRDKFALHNFCIAHKTPIIPTALSAIFPYPLFLKPRKGNGSLHCYVANDYEEASFYSKRMPEPIYQPLITGKKIVVDFISNKVGELTCFLSREELKSVAGNGTSIRIIEHNNAIEVTKQLVRALQFIGIGNCEFFVTPDEIYLIELNPRASSGIIFTYLAGVDILGEYLNLFLESKIDIEKKAIKYGQNLHRIYEVFNS